MPKDTMILASIQCVIDQHGEIHCGTIIQSAAAERLTQEQKDTLMSGVADATERLQDRIS